MEPFGSNRPTLPSTMHPILVRPDAVQVQGRVLAVLRKFK
jgi:hypothetical protein